MRKDINKKNINLVKYVETVDSNIDNILPGKLDG